MPKAEKDAIGTVWAEVERLERIAAEASKVPEALTKDGRFFNYGTVAGVEAAQADLNSYRFKKENWETNITLEGGPISLPWGLIIGRRQLDIDEARAALAKATPQ